MNLQLTIKEHFVESPGEHSDHYLHMYITLRGHEYYFFELTSQLNEFAVRKLAVYISCPLVFTDKAFLQEGSYQRMESLEEMQRLISNAKTHNKANSIDAKSQATD